MFDGGLTFRQIFPRKIPCNIFVTPFLFQIKILRPLSRQEFLKIAPFSKYFRSFNQRNPVLNDFTLLNNLDRSIFNLIEG